MRIFGNAAMWLGLLAGLAASSFPAAHAAEELVLAKQLYQVLRRPILRFFFIHTEEGALVGRDYFGFRITKEIQLKRVAKFLAESGNAEMREMLVPHLQDFEQRLRFEIAEAGPTGNAFVHIGDRAAESFVHTPGVAGKIQYLQTKPVTVGFEANLARLRGGPGEIYVGEDLSETLLAGQDLRLSRFKKALLGDLTGADLRGSDMRRAFIGSKTKLDGAIYDQFTALPFPRADAAAKGMRYVRSAVPKSYLYFDREALNRGAAASGAAAPEGASDIAPEVLRTLRTTAPSQARGIKIFRTPKYVKVRGTDHIKFEAGRVLKGDNAVYNEWIDELAEAGGEIRRIIVADPVTGQVNQQSMFAYFRLENDRPIIALGEDVELPVLAHEGTHFRDWKNLVKKYLGQGMTKEAALEAASNERGTAAYRAFTERNAVTAELKAQAKLDDQVGVPLAERKYRYEQWRFAATISYPEREGLGHIFREHKLAGIRASAELRAEAEGYARRIIHNFLMSRRGRFLNQGMTNAADFSAEDAFLEGVSTNVSRYAEDGVLNDIRNFYIELLPSEVAKLPHDAFRAALTL